MPPHREHPTIASTLPPAAATARLDAAPQSGQRQRLPWERGWALFRSHLHKYMPAPLLASVFRCYSEVFFINGSVAFGALIFASTLLSWNVGLSGIIAVLAAYGFARLIRLDQEFFQPGYYTYNPLLVGLSLGSMLQLSWLTVFYIGVAGVFALLLTIAMVHVFRYYLNLPVLSLPFAVCSVITYLAALRYSNLLIRSEDVLQLPAGLMWLHDGLEAVVLPIWLSGFLCSLGAVFFLPYKMVGLMFAALLLWRSRILFSLAVLGYFVGSTTCAILMGSTLQAFGDVNSFNFILIAMALGGVFLTPSLGSYFVAAVAVAGSTIVLDAMQMLLFQHDVPAYTLPFNIVSLGVLFVLGLCAYPRLACYIGLTPEETMENDHVSRKRYPGYWRTLNLPFFGRWTVWQAFDDEWTHQGTWRYAYDFVIADDDGRTFDGAGLQLSDYYCYRKPVLSPTRGRVIAVVGDRPDNPIGQVDKTNNWGNYVVLYDERGYYVELSHFAEGSIRVNPGDWVEPGSIVGLCGNSGYSPQPHIHVHIQMHSYPGSPTLPFSFLSYVESDTYRANDVPAKGQTLEPAPPVDNHFDALTGFLLGDRLTYDVCRDGTKTGTLTLTVSMALDGTLYFESDRGGRLYFGKYAGTFYAYRMEGRDKYLQLLFVALPRLPLSYRDGLRWQDFVPISLVAGRLQRALADLAACVVPQLATARTAHVFRDRQAIESEITAAAFGIQQKLRVEFDAERGFARVEVGRFELRRVEYATSS